MRRGNVGILNRLDVSALALMMLPYVILVFRHKDQFLNRFKWKKYPMKICLTFLFTLINLGDQLKCPECRRLCLR